MRGAGMKQDGGAERPIKGQARDGAGARFAVPHVTVDLVILSLAAGRLRVLLMKRGAAPFAGSWALPGGYIHPEEDADLDAAAHRILRQKTGIASPYLEQLQAFGDGRR